MRGPYFRNRELNQISQPCNMHHNDTRCIKYCNILIKYFNKMIQDCSRDMVSHVSIVDRRNRQITANVEQAQRKGYKYDKRGVQHHCFFCFKKLFDYQLRDGLKTLEGVYHVSSTLRDLEWGWPFDPSVRDPSADALRFVNGVRFVCHCRIVCDDNTQQ